VDCLKTEVYSDTDSYKPQYEEVSSYIEDYDEVFYDEEDEFDSIRVNQQYKLTKDNDGDGL
jgi:plasmid maintenance system killer protein